MNFDYEVKDRIRKNICSRKIVGRSAKLYNAIVIMPSSDALDLKVLEKKRAIGPFTHITAIERDPNIAKVIRKTLKDKGYRSFEVVESELYLADLGERQYDFAYFDTCGQLNGKILNWFAKQIQLKKFTDDAKVSMAFSTFFLGGPEFAKQAATFVKENQMRPPSIEIEAIGFDKVEQVSCVKSHKTMGALLKGLFGEPVQSIVYKNEGRHIPMHVFTFYPREINSGMGKVLKFVGSLGDKVDLITAGVKAAAKRLEVSANADKAIKAPKGRRGRPRIHKQDPFKPLPESPRKPSTELFAESKKMLDDLIVAEAGKLQNKEIEALTKRLAELEATVIKLMLQLQNPTKEQNTDRLVPNTGICV